MFPTAFTRVRGDIDTQFYIAQTLIFRTSSWSIKHAVFIPTRVPTETYQEF